MSKEIYISSTPHETRLAIVENDALTEIYYERENEYTLAGSIYNGKVTRVLPGMQSSFVDIGLERDAFLYITDFMEEAGDSADFEATGESRAPRGDRNGSDRNGSGDRGDRNGRDRNGRGDRSDRNGHDTQPRLPAGEPSDADLFTQAVSGLDPVRPVEGERSERSERGSRRGGRNRRDRNFNSDGTPRRDRSDAPRNDAPRPEPVRSESPTEFVPDAILPPTEQLGEASPGADGSRRWRGRRGRRGNRGRDESGRPSETGEVGASLTRFDETDVPSFDMGASAAAPIQTPVQPPVQPTDRAPRETREDRGPRGEGRPPRDDARGDRNRGDRAAQPPPRVPRGFSPSLSLYQVDAAEETLPETYTPYGQEPESSAPIEPIILPGESLSKYRAGSSEPSPRAEPTPTPVSEFHLPGAWDGGLVLPGETLRPRTPSASSEPSRSEDRSPRRDDRGGRDRDRGGRNDRGGRDNRGGRDSRSGRDDRSDRGPRTESFAQPVTPVYRPAPEPIHTEPIQTAEPDFAAHAVAPIHSTFVAPPPLPTPDELLPPHESSATFVADHTPAQPEAAAATPAHDFEPTEASASFRVDPVPPSEYRQSAPVAEDSFLESAAVSYAEPASFAEPEAAVDQSPIPHAEPAASVIYETQETHEHTAPEFTSINAFGEMHSKPIADTHHTHPVPHIDTPGPAAPIEHEAAVVDPAHAEVQAPPPALYFAPGDGHLEEEELVDDEESLTLHASSFEDQEILRDPDSLQDNLPDSFQETLEGGADLGTMLREMSIDNITRTEPAILDEEDEDEDEDDFLEEDQLEDDAFAGDSDYAEEDSPEELDSNESGDEEDEDEGEESVQTAAFEGAPAPTGDASQPDSREPRRDRSRDDRGRRDGRRGDRSRREGRGDGRGDRDRSSSSSSSSSSGDRTRDTRGGRGSRQSMQSTNLPAISDLLKPGQEILCQIAKEPIAKKGARITSHIALPGRFLVFMPTVHHTGVSRKIESDSERRRLKEILISERGESTGGFIVRTAAAGASEEELRSDLRFLLNLWADIKTRSESSKSPALIYHDLNLIERVLRDQVTDNFSAIWVDTESEYERVLRFLQRFQPSLIRRVKLYTKETPLFEQFGITEEINKALRSKVWLKSGGSIVINQTEALVAIDINTGKFVGKTARLEDTIVKTNLDAIPEIVRQIRLRDLGGIIIIDFIDMDERKNRNKVMAALEEELKSDRAPSKVLQFNDFGLVAITRKRVKQSLERTLSTTCGVCQGTGMVKSPVSVCNDIYIEMRKMHKHLDRGDVMLRVHPEVVKQLKSSTKWLQEMEEMVGKTILVKSDPSLHPEQFDIH